MDYEEIYKRLKNLIMNAPAEIGITADFTRGEELNLIGLNSISFIKLAVLIENEFGFEFDDEDLDSKKYKSITDIVTYIQNRTKG